LLGHDQRGCEHTPKVLSTLEAMFTRVVALVLEMPRSNPMTFLVLVLVLVLTTRFAGITTAQ